jgi:transposase
LHRGEQNLTNNKQEVVEVLTGPERRQRWPAEEKVTMVRESFEPGKSVSMIARQHGVNPDQLLEEVVPASELSDALKQIGGLRRLLGR